MTELVIALLEDDPRRTRAMIDAARCVSPAPVLIFDNAPDMLDWLRDYVDCAMLIALDHDLGPSRAREGERFEPGVGRDVVDYLADCPPVCPVVIHSSNSPAALGMQFCLEAAGWTVARVFPYDDLAWIERDWLPQVQRLLPGGEGPR
jgi:hypothetical protein